MAKYLNSILKGENNPRVHWFGVAASQTIKEGDLVQINASSGLLEAAVAASTTIAGIANADITTGASPTAKDRIPVTLVKDAIIRIDFIGSTKTTLTDADKFTKSFDLSSKTAVNLDDTTGGMMQIWDYNNTKKTADVVVTAAAQFVK